MIIHLFYSLSRDEAQLIHFGNHAAQTTRVQFFTHQQGTPEGDQLIRQYGIRQFPAALFCYDNGNPITQPFEGRLPDASEIERIERTRR